MLVFAWVMAAATVATAVGLAVDDRTLAGSPMWLKPFKFAVSMALYSVTWSWMFSLLYKGKRFASWVSSGLVAALAIEFALMAVQAFRGRASHFNAETAFDARLFTIMGYAIAALWIGTLILTVMVCRAPIADLAERWAIRLGALIALAGLALGVLMVTPTADQTRQRERTGTSDAIGAHTVGAPDGGAGMPITGWSLTGGDLRIPHFVGIHALQLLPLFALALGALARRTPALRSGTVRARLVLTAALGYAGLVALVTWQALRGQPLTSPDAATLLALAALVAAVAGGAVLALRAPVPDRPAPHTEPEVLQR
ncbi:hypothetical protein CFN78_02370 [Amycolatopsis antarctica]|uniref:Uncharacterized protein n=2 Tax=Amycolatopsis antarctica TaxID=1854586 RepID=A0A263DC22_9PSEU|nr:hypothetical protein CFN78_02370 [Amycolatopsis antarctica]